MTGLDRRCAGGVLFFTFSDGGGCFPGMPCSVEDGHNKLKSFF